MINVQLPLRSIKYYQGVVAGSWILCFDWIEQCLNKNALVSENKYEVLGDKKANGGCKKSRQLRQNKNDNGLFSNIICVLADEFLLPGLYDNLKSMFRMGGADVKKMFPFQWLKDINKYKKEQFEMKKKIMIFVYDKEGKKK
eukprot:56860_1